MSREELQELAASLSSANTNGDDAAIAGKTLEDGSLDSSGKKSCYIC